MIKNTFLHSSDPFPSQTLQIPFMGGLSTTSSHNNSPTKSLAPSPPVVDHDSSITIIFDRIQSLEENLRDIEGFLNQENVLPQARSVVNTLGYILILDKKGLEMLRELSIIVKIHVPLAHAPIQDVQSKICVSQLGVDILGLTIHIVDLGSTIPSINASTIPLGYTGMSCSQISTSTTTQVSTINAITTFISSTNSLGGADGGGGSGSLGGTSRDGGTSGPPPPLRQLIQYRTPSYKKWGRCNYSSPTWPLLLVNHLCLHIIKIFPLISIL